MKIRNNKLFINIILLIGFFAIANLTAVAMEATEAEVDTKQEVGADAKQEVDAMQEADTMQEAEVVEINLSENDIDNHSKQSSTPITEDNQAISLEQLAKKSPEEITIAEKVTCNNDATEKQNAEDKKSNEGIENNKQDHGLLIEDSYISINAGDNAAAYLTVKNTTDTNMRLKSAKVQDIKVQDTQDVKVKCNELVKKIEIHETRHLAGIVKMQHKKHGFKIKANSEIKLQKGGKHIMLFGINKDFFKAGENINLILKFITKDKNIIEVIHNFDVQEFKCKKCCGK